MSEQQDQAAQATATPDIPARVTLDLSKSQPLAGSAPAASPTPSSVPADVPAGVTLDLSKSQPLAPATPDFSVGQALFGEHTMMGAPVQKEWSDEASGVSDIFHGDIRQGLSKVWQSEAPHVIAGSPIEKIIQKVNPDFRGAATQQDVADFNARKATAQPLIDAAQFIDKSQHPVTKAIAEAAQSFTSPENVSILVATGGFGMVENPAALAIANRLISAGFAAQSIGQLYQHSAAFKKAYDEGNQTEALYQATHAVLSGSMTAMAAQHAAGVTPTPSTAVGRAAENVVDATKSAVARVGEAVGVDKVTEAASDTANWAGKKIIQAPAGLVKGVASVAGAVLPESLTTGGQGYEGRAQELLNRAQKPKSTTYAARQQAALEDLASIAREQDAAGSPIKSPRQAVQAINDKLGDIEHQITESADPELIKLINGGHIKLTIDADHLGDEISKELDEKGFTPEEIETAKQKILDILPKIENGTLLDERKAAIKSATDELDAAQESSDSISIREARAKLADAESMDVSRAGASRKEIEAFRQRLNDESAWGRKTAGPQNIDVQAARVAADAVRNQLYGNEDGTQAGRYKSVYQRLFSNADVREARRREGNLIAVRDNLNRAVTRAESTGDWSPVKDMLSMRSGVLTGAGFVLGGPIGSGIGESLNIAHDFITSKNPNLSVEYAFKHLAKSDLAEPARLKKYGEIAPPTFEPPAGKYLVQTPGTTLNLPVKSGPEGFHAGPLLPGMGGEAAEEANAAKTGLPADTRITLTDAEKASTGGARPVAEGATPEQQFQSSFGAEHQQAKDLAEWETGKSEPVNLADTAKELAGKYDAEFRGIQKGMPFDEMPPKMQAKYPNGLPDHYTFNDNVTNSSLMVPSDEMNSEGFVKRLNNLRQSFGKQLADELPTHVVTDEGKIVPAEKKASAVDEANAVSAPPKNPNAEPAASTGGRGEDRGSRFVSALHEARSTGSPIQRRIVGETFGVDIERNPSKVLDMKSEDVSPSLRPILKKLQLARLRDVARGNPDLAKILSSTLDMGD